MKLLFFAFLFVATTTATNITYTDVPQSNFTELQDPQVVTGLGHLFVMSRTFVDLVFQPFSVIEEFVFRLLSTSNYGVRDDFLQTLLNDWQTLASFEVGYMVCLVFGCLFVIFVPLIGSIMCCCRTCCNNCGGKMEQSLKRGRSGWRHCLCGTLFIFTVFMAIPCVFVFLTNVWASDAIQQIPTVTVSAINDLNNYVGNLPDQLQHVIGEYGKLDESIRDDLDNIDESLGEPIRDSFMTYTQPTLDELTALNNDTKEALSSMEAVKTATSALDSGIDELNNELSRVKTALDNDLTNAGTVCSSNIVCTVVQGSTNALGSSGANFSGLASIDQEIENFNNTLNTYNIDEEVNRIVDQINEIPELVVNNSQVVVEQILNTLDSVNETLNSAVNNVPLDTINGLQNTLSDFGSILEDAISFYDDNFDVYRYAAGAALASVLAVIVALYWLGMISGTFSFSSYPSDRGSCSNFGGIMVMAAVGFSFIFSWLFMILVIITFTLGGHGERYICQNLEPPYEGLRFADRVFNAANAGVNVSILSTMQRCEENQAIYVAARLENIFNITAAVGNATDVIENFRDHLGNFSVDLSNINFFPPAVSNALDSMKGAGLDGINFTAYLEEISKGLTSQGLVEYAQFLNDSATNMTLLAPGDTSTANLADTIRGHSYEILLIQQNNVDPLSTSLDTLNSSVLRLQNISIGFNDSIDALSDSLEQLNTSIQTNGSERVATVTSDFANSLIDDVLGYIDYLLDQLNEHLGACRPLFVFYSKLTQVLCSYLMELINGFWFSLGWCVFFLIPSAIVGMKLAKFYRRMKDVDTMTDTRWNDIEMDSVHHSNKKFLTGERLTPDQARIMHEDRSALSSAMQSTHSRGQTSASPKRRQTPSIKSSGQRGSPVIEKVEAVKLPPPSEYAPNKMTLNEEKKMLNVISEKNVVHPDSRGLARVEREMTSVTGKPAQDVTSARPGPEVADSSEVTFVQASSRPEVTYGDLKSLLDYMQPEREGKSLDINSQSEMTNGEFTRPDMTQHPQEYHDVGSDMLAPLLNLDMENEVMIEENVEAVTCRKELTSQTDVTCNVTSQKTDGVSQDSRKRQIGLCVKSHQHITSLNVGSRLTRRAASEVKNADEILNRWKQSSKIHPEGYY